MKKQLSTAILFASILLSCKKDTIDVLDPIRTETVTGTANRIITSKKGTIMLQEVILHNSMWFEFGWEYDADGNPRIVKGTVKSGFYPGGGSGSAEYGHTWTQEYVYPYSGNPNIINMLIVGKDEFSSTGRFPVMKVTKIISIKISYNVSNDTYTITGISDGGTIKNKP